MSTSDDTTKIQKFSGSRNDDYSLWRLRAEIALKGKGFWTELEKKDCSEDIKNKSSAMLVAALGDTALRVCSSKIGQPLQMLEMLDNRFASSRTATRISVLTTMYTKRFNSRKDNMGKFIDEFETLFAQLERMGPDTKIPESHKAPLLLASMGTTSQLESTVAALRTKDTDELTWETVTSDLIQEWKHIKSSHHSGDHNRHQHRLPGGSTNPDESNLRAYNGRHSGKGGPIKCDFCGKIGHKAERCFINPNSKYCKLPEKAIKALLANKTSAQSEPKNDNRVQFGGIAKFKSHKSICKPSVSILDSGATITMFKEKYETEDGSYKKGSNDTVELAVGSEEIDCLVKGTVSLENIKLDNSVHVDGLNETLFSVGQICDTGRIVVFTKSEAVIINQDRFSVKKRILRLLQKEVLNQNSMKSILNRHIKQASVRFPLA